MLSAKQVPYTGPYSLPEGPHRSAGPTARALKRAMKRAGLGFENRSLDQLDDHYNRALEEAMERAHPEWSGYGEKRWEWVRTLKADPEGPNAGEYALDPMAQHLIREEFASRQRPIPALGAVHLGQSAVLLMELTHITSGIDEDPLDPDEGRYPAFDSGWKAGLPCLAPEPLEVVKQSSAQGADAFYARGASKIKWWFGHIVKAPANGTKLRKGQQFGVISGELETPHLHTGINTDDLLGFELYTPGGYQRGGPTVGEQLTRALA
jgi:hypothetical protein